ncbi:HEPN domain-containing protein [Candidatus Woesearchaeota archaeon]|nr:HEPN domain-containing protein [Candidatus Woesearchaeota archaeon]
MVILLFYEWWFLTKILRIKPNIIISESFLNQAEITLSKIQRSIEEGDYLWASVKIYYSAYYSLTAFLWRVGLKSENHDCAIKITAYVLNDTEIEKTLDNLKSSRIDNQYYLKISDASVLKENYEAAKLLYAKFYNLLHNSNNNKFTQKIDNLFKN